MPLLPDADRIIRSNLEQIMRGERARVLPIGTLTDKQFAALNQVLAQRKAPPVENNVLFLGRHHYERRMLANGYSIDDVIEQIHSAMGENCVIEGNRLMIALVNKAGRAGENGAVIRDRAVLECTSRNPRIELLSVVPEGDGKAPGKQKNAAINEKGRVIAAPGVESPADSPG